MHVLSFAYEDALQLEDIKGITIIVDSIMKHGYLVFFCTLEIISAHTSGLMMCFQIFYWHFPLQNQLDDATREPAQTACAP